MDSTHLPAPPAAMAAPAPAAISASTDFDYASLSGEEARALRAGAERIKSLGRRMAGHILEIGTELLVAKAALKHGQFGVWLKAEFGWTERTARNYMRAAKKFGDKPEIVSDFTPSAINLLASPSTPDKVRADVLEQAKAGKPPCVEAIKAMAAAARKEERAHHGAEPSTTADRREGRRKRKDAEHQQRDYLCQQAEARADDAAADIAAILRAELSNDVLDHLGDLGAKLDHRHDFASLIKTALNTAVAAARRERG